MIHSPESAKSRTVALPHVNKGLIQGRQNLGKLSDRGAMGEGAWGPMIFGPYLVPLSRRAE